MTRILLVLNCLLFALTSLAAQDSTEMAPPLNAEQLEREKWYYSIDEAMREPDQVYKLSLTDAKLKYFPTEIVNFPNLQILYLGNNKIKEIPAEIADLKNLQVLNLANNKVRSLPDEMSELEHLSHMYLARNKIVSMPAWVGGLSQLRLLDLAYNNVTQYDIELVRYRLPNCEVTH